jgi:RecJ-like exonuclease
MSTSNDRAFAKAQASYDAQTPDDDDSPDCENCDGAGTVHVADVNGEIDILECPVCKGHGNMDAVRAENEIDAQIERWEARQADMRESRDGGCYL